MESGCTSSTEKRSRKIGIQVVSNLHQFSYLQNEFPYSCCSQITQIFWLHGSRMPRVLTIFELQHLSGAKIMAKSGTSTCGRVLVEQETAQNQQTRPAGRQMDWMIHDFFKINDTHQSFMDLHGILEVEWKGDNLRALSTKWDGTVINMRKPARRKDPEHCVLLSCARLKTDGCETY